LSKGVKKIRRDWKIKVDWRRSWYILPLVSLRVLFLGSAYLIFEPLAKGFEFIGSKLPGLKFKK